VATSEITKRAFTGSIFMTCQGKRLIEGVALTTKGSFVLNAGIINCIANAIFDHWDNGDSSGIQCSIPGQSILAMEVLKELTTNQALDTSNLPLHLGNVRPIVQAIGSLTINTIIHNMLTDVMKRKQPVTYVGAPFGLNDLAGDATLGCLVGGNFFWD
jgi:hypothetical protein